MRNGGFIVSVVLLHGRVPALVTCDIATRRRIHPATAWGFASYLVVRGASVGLAFSAVGHRFVQSLL